MTLPYQSEARAAVGDELFRYMLGRALDGDAEDANETALRRYFLVPRVLTRVDWVNTTTKFLGMQSAAPLMIGAFAGDRLFHREGLMPVARACRTLALPLIVSEETVTPLADICAEHDMVLLQLRAAGPVERVQALVDMAAGAGAKGIVLTVLAPVHPVQGMQPGGFDVGQVLREKGWKTIGSDGPGPQPLPAFPQWTGEQVAKVVSTASGHGMPVVLKGILHPGDVAGAEATGAKGIAVSNIGLRQSGRWLASPHAVRAVRHSAASDTAVLLDGGVRHGSDVLTACLLGANAAIVSRPVLSALAGGGEACVEAYLKAVIDAVAALTMWMGAESPSALGRDQITIADGGCND
jgi:4-hydroxymandelate oxidase